MIKDNHIFYIPENNILQINTKKMQNNDNNNGGNENNAHHLYLYIRICVCI